MKILFINNFLHIDYLNDSLYHGLIDSGHEVYESHYPGYMLKSFDNSKALINKGFTLHGKLEHTPKIDTSNTIIEKLKSNFYDQIIYGNIYTTWYRGNRNCFDYLDYVKKCYPKEKVHFLDGSDDTYNFAGALGLYKYGTIWKSSSIPDKNYTQSLFFGIPEKQLIQNKPVKEKIYSNIIPGKTETYIYDNEKDYYNDYATSYYGFTWKKAQWECLRHIEILANRCIPYFLGLENCPEEIMLNFPKNFILETNKFAKKNKVHPCYNEINDIVFQHTKEHLTTKNVAKTVVEYSKSKSVYFFAPFFATSSEETSPEVPLVILEGNSNVKYAKEIFASLQNIYFNSVYDWRNSTLRVRLTEWIINFDDGYSGKLFRAFLNTLISCIDVPKYLEIGVWTGSTIFSAMDKNFAEVTAIGNWKNEIHDDMKQWFYANIPGVVTHVNKLDILELPFTEIDFTQIKKHNIYSYNGEDENIPLPVEALEDVFVFIVSNWNFFNHREKVFNKLKECNIKIEYSISIETTNNGNGVADEYAGYKHNWHNGYFIAVCSKI